LKALLSVYDKAGLIEFAQGLQAAGVRLLGSGGTAKKIRDAGIPIEYGVMSSIAPTDSRCSLFQGCLRYHEGSGNARGQGENSASCRAWR